MTLEERIDMYHEKAAFIHRLDWCLTTPRPKGLTIERVSYEVYEMQHGGFVEFIVVTYVGGAISPICVSGNSNAANFQIVAELCDKGNYIQIGYYEQVKETSVGKLEV